VKGIGQVLRQAREAQGLSVAEMYQRTHIREWIVEAIEAENFAAIPGGSVYARGFVRRLCAELQLDFSLLSPGALSQAEGDKQSLPQYLPRRQANRASLVGVLLVAIALTLAALYWFFWLPPAPQPPRATPPPIVVPTIPPPPPPPVVAQPTFTLVGVQGGRYVYTVDTWPMLLKIVVREEQCWVMVQVDGAAGRSTMLHGGQSMEVTAANSLLLRLGRARVADIIINGQVLPRQTGDVKDFTFAKTGP